MAANIAVFPLQENNAVIRQFNRGLNPLERFNNRKLFKRFRFEHEGIMFLVDLLRKDLERDTGRSKALSAELQVLLALRFFASGAFLEVIGDTLGVDKASVSRAVRDVANALHQKRDIFVRWPINNEEIRKVRLGFYEIAGFPRVIGCIDCTHVRIICPSVPTLDVGEGNADLNQAVYHNVPDNRARQDMQEAEEQLPGPQNGQAGAPAAEVGLVPVAVPMDPTNYEASFVNRKGYHSLNIQAVCDHKGKFTNIVARWPGATHDSFIFQNSQQGSHMEDENGRGEKGILLGDSGYPCKPYLMTPYGNPVNPHQQNFNNALCSTRVRIEHAFGVLKRRFHVLHGEVRMRPGRVIKIISACTVLHNIAIMRGEREPPEEESDSSDIEVNSSESESDDDDDDDEGYDGPQSGQLYREYMTNKYF